MLKTFICRYSCAAHTMGVTGQGPLWQDLAGAVEKELGRKVDRSGKLRLHIERNARREVRKPQELGSSSGLN